MTHAISWIARRFFFARRKTRFLPFLTMTAIGGVAIGTCAMVVIMSVMHGFSVELEKRLLGFNPHITVAGPQATNLEADALMRAIGYARVADIAPFVEGEVIVESQLGDELFAQGARLRGIDAAAAGAMSSILYHLPDNKPLAEALMPSHAPTGRAGIVLGQDILGQLNVHPDFGDDITVIAPLADVGPAGEIEPRLKRFRLTGSFATGIYEYDTNYALVAIDEARDVLGAQASFGWQIRLKHPRSAPAVSAALGRDLGEGFVVEGWHERNRKLFAALKLERIAVGSVMVLVVLIASFSVIGVILMVVSSKRKDIALLKAMGMRSGEVRRIFLCQGIWIGIVGGTIGAACGTFIAAALAQWPIRLPQSYYLDSLAVSVLPGWSALIALFGIVLSMLASLYPVVMATREEPILALRYE